MTSRRNLHERPQLFSIYGDDDVERLVLDVRTSMPSPPFMLAFAWATPLSARAIERLFLLLRGLPEVYLSVNCWQLDLADVSLSALLELRITRLELCDVPYVNGHTTRFLCDYIAQSKTLVTLENILDNGRWPFCENVMQTLCAALAQNRSLVNIVCFPSYTGQALFMILHALSERPTPVALQVLTAALFNEYTLQADNLSLVKTIGQLVRANKLSTLIMYRLPCSRDKEAFDLFCDILAASTSLTELGVLEFSPIVTNYKEYHQLTAALRRSNVQVFCSSVGWWPASIPAPRTFGNELAAKISVTHVMRPIEKVVPWWPMFQLNTPSTLETLRPANQYDPLFYSMLYGMVGSEYPAVEVSGGHLLRVLGDMVKILPSIERLKYIRRCCVFYTPHIRDNADAMAALRTWFMHNMAFCILDSPLELEQEQQLPDWKRLWEENGAELENVLEPIRDGTFVSYVADPSSDSGAQTCQIQFAGHGVTTVSTRSCQLLSDLAAAHGGGDMTEVLVMPDFVQAGDFVAATAVTSRCPLAEHVRRIRAANYLHSPFLQQVIHAFFQYLCVQYSTVQYSTVRYRIERAIRSSCRTAFRHENE